MEKGPFCFGMVLVFILEALDDLTRWERLKSAPYLRLKKLKLFEIVKGGTFGFFEKKEKSKNKIFGPVS